MTGEGMEWENSAEDRKDKNAAAEEENDNESDEKAVATAGDAETCPVTVAVHVRPLLLEERGNLDVDKDASQIEDLVCLQVHQQKQQKGPGDEPRAKSSSSALLNVSNGKHVFEYDYVYSDPTLHGRCPSKLYQDCVEPLVQGLFSGYSATIFAYGQTGSGKTYTMGGLDSSSFSSSRNSRKGIIPSAVDTLYESLAKKKAKVEGTKVTISYVEIYNEEIRDLLFVPDQQQQSQSQEIHIRESGDGAVHLIGCSEVEVKDKEHMCLLFQQGVKLRSTSKTGMNKQSSRSHAIFTISIETKQEKTKAEAQQGEKEENDKDNDNDNDHNSGSDSDEEFEVLRGKMHLVDLAGSERVKRTLAEGSTFKEGVNINKGLLALGNVISALAGEASAPQDQQDLTCLNSNHKDSSTAAAGADGANTASNTTTHVPYRDSKLTRILRDALGGNSKTVMIACVSPSTLDCDESVNTLRYAQRAKNITNIVTKDMLDSQSNNVEALRQALNRSRAENAILKKQLCLCRSEVSTLKSIIKFGTQKASLDLPVKDQRLEYQAVKQTLAPAEPKSAWVDTEVANAANTSVDRGQDQQVAAEELHTLDSRMKKLEEALVEKEAAMHQVRKGVDQMHEQLVKTCVSPCSFPSGSVSAMLELKEGPAKGNVTEEREGNESGAAAPNNEMQVLVQSMEREMGELQAQKLDLLQQLQEYAASSEKAVLQENVSSSTRSRANSKKKSKQQSNGETNGRLNSSAGSSAKETRQRQMLLDKVKRLESVLTELKQKHAKLVGLERLKKKSDAICDRLKKDVEEIKRQKCQLVREINQKTKKFASYQKTTRKEMQSLQKEKSKVEHARSKLEINKEKQLQALKRKTEECNKHKIKLKQLTRKDSGKSSALDGSSKYNSKDLSGDVPEFQPNALAPLLRDERSRQVWIEEEIEACTMLEKIRDSLKESHANNVECSQCIKSLKNKSRLLERKIEKSKRNSSSSSNSDNPLNSQQVESWEVELEQAKAQLSCMEKSKKELDENMKSLEGDLARLMHQKAASFMLNVNDVSHSDDATRDSRDNKSDARRESCVSSSDAQRFAKTLISGKHGMNAKGMSTDLRRWSGLRSLAEARGMLRIVFSKAVNARIEMIKSQQQSELVQDQEEEAIDSAVEVEQNSRGTEDVVAVDESIPQPNSSLEAKLVKDHGKEKKHSYVSKGWIDDILKEQAEHMTMLTQWEKEKQKKTRIPSSDYKSPKEVSRGDKDLENHPEAAQLEEKRGKDEKQMERADSGRLVVQSLRPKLGWAETKQVINDVLEKRRNRAPLRASNK